MDQFVSIEEVESASGVECPVMVDARDAASIPRLWKEIRSLRCRLDRLRSECDEKARKACAAVRLSMKRKYDERLSRMRETAEIQRLSDENADLRRQLALASRSSIPLTHGCEGFGMQSPPKPTMSIQSVRSSMESEWSCPGNYFAWSGGEVVYVGASANMFSRITGRHPQLFPEDLVSVIPCSMDRVFVNERFYQWYFEPVRNGFRS